MVTKSISLQHFIVFIEISITLLFLGFCMSYEFYKGVILPEWINIEIPSVAMLLLSDILLMMCAVLPKLPLDYWKWRKEMIGPVLFTIHCFICFVSLAICTVESNRCIGIFQVINFVIK